MKNILFTGGSSLLAQSWINKNPLGLNFILGIHKKQLNQIKTKTFVLNHENLNPSVNQLHF